MSLDNEVTVAVQRPVRRWMRWLVGVVIAGIAASVLNAAAGGLGQAFTALRHMRPQYVAVGLGLVVLRFALYGKQLRWLSNRRRTLGPATAAGLAFVVYGFGAVTPAAPLEGLAIAANELKRWGWSKHDTHLLLGFSEWFAQRTFYAVAAANLVVAVAVGHLAISQAWPLLIAAAVVVGALGMTSALIRGEHFARGVAVLARLLRFRSRHDLRIVQEADVETWRDDAVAFLGPPRRRAAIAMFSAAAVVCDSGALWASSHAAGFHVRPDVVLLVATVGTVVSWIPLLPSGLGLVEAAIPALLHRFGAPLDGAIAATVVYRAIATLLPALAGMGVIVGLRTTRGRHTPRGI